MRFFFLLSMIIFVAVDARRAGQTGSSMLRGRLQNPAPSDMLKEITEPLPDGSMIGVPEENDVEAEQLELRNQLDKLRNLLYNLADRRQA